MDAPSGTGTLTVFTEGLVPCSPTTRHARALNAIQGLMAKPAGETVQTVLLQPAGNTSTPWGAGLAGLSRTVMREFPGYRSLALSLSAASRPTDVELDAIVQLCTHAETLDDSSVTIAEDGRIFAFRLAPLASLNQPLAPPISHQDVFLVTGGGQGITAACTIALAKRTGAHFILTGRTQPIDWPAFVAPDVSETDLRTMLSKEAAARGERPTPKSVSTKARQLIGARSIKNTLSTLRRSGASGEYVQMDLTAPDSIKQTVTAILKAKGRITGLIHGAGVLSDRRLLAMTSADIATVFAPKVDGLRTLIDIIGMQNLQHIALFSSAAAHFGNVGQANYAMANNMLSVFARHADSRMPNGRVRAFGWGPWDGGMVTPALKAAFAERGINTIDLDTGAELFADLMMHDFDGVDLAIGAI